QIINNITNTLKEEEWLLDAVGLSTLRNNNLLPTIDNPIKTKDIYEAFLRFDDKPMITGKEAVSRSLLKYCANGEFCIATGDGSNFTRYYLQETIPFFDVDDSTYWLVEKSLKPVPQTKSEYSGTETPSNTDNSQPNSFNEPEGTKETTNQPDVKTDSKKYKSITVLGKIPLEYYTQ